MDIARRRRVVGRAVFEPTLSQRRDGEFLRRPGPEMAMAQTPSGPSFDDMRIGAGPIPRRGQICVMHDTGWLWESGAKARKFDSSVVRGDPFALMLGVGQVIGGWNEGVAGMAVGAWRTLRIPPHLGYGAGGAIPSNATLVFEVELLDLK